MKPVPPVMRTFRPEKVSAILSGNASRSALDNVVSEDIVVLLTMKIQTLLYSPVLSLFIAICLS